MLDYIVYTSYRRLLHHVELFDVIILGSYEELAGSNFLIHEGFVSVIHALACTIPEHCIFLNHHVKRINWTHGLKHAEVHCENGHVFTADHVIVTASLGYLKAEHNSLFDPPLPKQKAIAIEQLGFGAVDKVILEFENSVFGEAYRRIDLLWNQDEEHDLNTKEHWYRKINAVEMITPKCLQGELLLVLSNEYNYH